MMHLIILIVNEVQKVIFIGGHLTDFETITRPHCMSQLIVSK